MGQDAAFEEGFELVFDELRQVGAGSVFGLGEAGRGVLLHRAPALMQLDTSVTGQALAIPNADPDRAMDDVGVCCQPAPNNH